MNHNSWRHLSTYRRCIPLSGWHTAVATVWTELVLFGAQ